jgi:tight adherence protein B
MRRWMALLAVAVLAALGWTAAASAETESGINIDHVQVDEDGNVLVLLALDELPRGAVPDPASRQVRIGDTEVQAVAQPVDGSEIRRTAVLVLDVSGSMRGRPIEAVREAARAYLDAAPPDVEIGLLTFSTAIIDDVAPSRDREAVGSVIDGVEAGGFTALYDALIAAVESAGDDGARSIVLVADGEDNRSEATPEEAIEAAAEAGVVVDVVSLVTDVADRAVLDEIAQGARGRVVDADPEVVLQAFTDRAEAYSKQWAVSFERPPGVGPEATVEISVSADGVSYTTAALIALPPQDSGLVVAAPPATGLGTPALVAGAGALAIGMAFLLWIGLGGIRQGPTMAQQQMAYLAGELPAGGSGARPGAVGGGAETGTLRETMVAAAQHVVKGDLESRLLLKLQGAGARLLPAEWLLLHSGVAIAAAFAGFVLAGPALAVMSLLLGALAPWIWLRWRHNRRGAAFHEQLPASLQIISGGLSAGLSLPQALDTVVAEGAEPMRGELRRALSESRLGVDIPDAMESIAQRMASEDFGWVVMAIRIQREVGGNLAELLNTVADTLREREHLRGQVRVLSAEGRISAIVLGVLPPAMFVYLLLVRPDFVYPLYTTLPGLLMLATAVGMLGAGYVVLSRMIRIEV